MSPGEPALWTSLPNSGTAGHVRGFTLYALKLKRCKDSPANAGLLFQPEGGLGGEGPEAPRPAQLPLHWSRLTDKQSFILSACVKRIPALWEGLEGCVRFSFQP